MALFQKKLKVLETAVAAVAVAAVAIVEERMQATQKVPSGANCGRYSVAALAPARLHMV